MNLPALANQQPSFLVAHTFEACNQIVDMMVQCATLPAHLKNKGECFRIVAQASQWGMNPFAVAECTSVVHGRLCYEGKLVHAVLINMGAIKGSLDFEYSGNPGTDQRTVVVSGTLQNGQIRTVTGTVADWKTTGAGSPWKPGAYDRQLAYRGTREWARMWAPQAVLGVYAPDEIEDVKTVQAESVTTTTVADPKPAKSKKAKDQEQATPAAVEKGAGDQASAQTAGAGPSGTTESNAGQSPAAGDGAPTNEDLDKAARSLWAAGPAGQVRLKEINTKWKLNRVSDMGGESDEVRKQFYAEMKAALAAVGGQ